MAQDVEGTVYLIHFSRPFSHAVHYAGWAVDVQARLADHRSGRGANLTRHVVAAGISLELARIWPARTRRFERSIKGRGMKPLCPICNPALAERLEKAPCTT